MRTDPIRSGEAVKKGDWNGEWTLMNANGGRFGGPTARTKSAQVSGLGYGHYNGTEGL
jgi:hypothetical protein